jgi:site-specific recombinase XerD
MALYGTGVRRAELARLKITDIDSQRMIIHIQGGKGRKDRDVMLSPKLLQALREYWRGLRRKPTDWLFPGGRWHTAHHPITTKVVWNACQKAAQRAGIHKKIHPHTLRQASAYYTTFQSSFILKTIGLGQLQSAAVYGRSGLLRPEPAQLAIVDPFDR